MNLETVSWNHNTYQEFLTYLHSFKDDKYRMFHGRLLRNSSIINIGIRTPILQKIAKEISKGDYLSFIEYISHQFYEEDVIYGLILGYIKVNWEERLSLLNKFLPFINNWSTNDLVCANLKIFSCEQEKGFKYIQKCLKSKNSWTLRFGIVLLLDYYINDHYIDLVITICKNLKHDDYYVLMALAWLISICYIKYPKKTICLLKDNYLDNFAHNKTIQKIVDSKRVSTAEKQQLKTLKRSKEYGK